MNTEDVVFNEMLENLQMGVFRCAIGNQPQFLYLNSRMISMLGLGQNKNIAFASIFADSRQYKNLYHQLLNEGSVNAVELELKGRGRKQFLASVSAVTVKNKEGRNVYIDGTVDDVSLRRN